ncbi:MAG: hypothetical protein HZB16_02475 [Armatimonadetes bacterium]|nr:hypothetical protein [Armatimonadota bacterium]
MNLAWRGMGALIGLGALLLAGCGRDDGAPLPPAQYKAWTRMWPDQAVRQVKFEYPGNWQVEVDRRRGGSVTVKATDFEWWRLQYNPTYVKATVEQFADAVRADRQRRRGDILTSDLSPVTVADHEGIRLNYEVLGEKTKGVRYVLEGGWVIEYEARDAQKKVVSNAFGHMSNSVDLTENR